MGAKEAAVTRIELAQIQTESECMLLHRKRVKIYTFTGYSDRKSFIVTFETVTRSL